MSRYSDVDGFIKSLVQLSPEIQKIYEESIAHDEQLLLCPLMADIVAEFIEPCCEKESYDALRPIFTFLETYYRAGPQHDEVVENAIHVSFLEGIAFEDYMPDIKKHGLLGKELARGIENIENWKPY